MATYINREIPKELKASGQTFNGLLNLGVARIIGSMAGGVAIANFGLRDVFLYNAIIVLITIIVFIVIVWRMEKNNSERKAEQGS